MDFIPDKQLYAAVMFARKMIREGGDPGSSISRAADYYGYSTSDVAHYVGQAAAEVRNRKRKRRTG